MPPMQVYDPCGETKGGNFTKVLLIDVDSKLPNLALMKLSAWHKARGDKVQLIKNPKSFYKLDWWAFNKIYFSCIFSKNAERARRWYNALRANIDAQIGGYGANGAKLPNEIEHIMPDYDLYSCDFSMGFTSRGCVRNCPWCVVPKMEGPIRPNAPILEFLRDDHNKIILFDNNFLAAPYWRENLILIQNYGLRVNFNQGLDIRLVDEENAGMLADCLYYDWKFRERRLHFAFDVPKIEPEVRLGVQILQDAGIPPHRLMFYMLCGFGYNYYWDDHKEEVFHRFETLNELGVDPFVMIWNNRRDIPELRHFARWVNKRIYKREPNFKNYDPSIGHGRKPETLSV